MISLNRFHLNENYIVFIENLNKNPIRKFAVAAYNRST